MTTRNPVLTISVTERGRALARRLPFDSAHGDAAATVRSQWSGRDGFVLFLAAGAAVRIIGPLLDSKATDPAVVCVDEAGRYAVALAGGHQGGANALAREVAEALGAEPVVTTATDSAGLAALDQLRGFVASGDIAAVTVAILDGRPVAVENPREWPLPTELPTPGARGLPAGRILVTDAAGPAGAGTVLLHPPSLVAGIGCSSGAPGDEVSALLNAALASAGLARESVAEVATIDIKAGEPAITGLGLPVRTFPASHLAPVPVPNPSPVVDAAVGTASVAEAAALLAAGREAELVVAKRTSAHATVAVTRRKQPRGHLAVVGLGPGHLDHCTPAASEAVRSASVVIGYDAYVEQCARLLTPSQEILASPIGDEVVRAKQALAEAAAGRRVAVVCSGDAGVYAMASLVTEMAADWHPAGDLAPRAGADFAIEVIPGVTAGLAAAALLGAPLGHDHAVISLSDLLTPWPVIQRRLEAAAAADLVAVLYNPRSRRRDWQLDAALRIFLGHRPPSTPVGVVTNAFRPAQEVAITTLGAIDSAHVGMTSVVIVGSRATRSFEGGMVTPRGYRP